MPMLHLLEHLLLAGLDLLGQGLEGTRCQGQAGFQQTAQCQ